VGNEGVILSSTDGMRWVEQLAITDERLRGVSYGHNRFVAVGYEGTLLTSKDGVRWERVDSHTHERLQGIEFGNDTFVAVGWHGKVLTSRDGLSWTGTSAGGGNLNSIVWQNESFVVTTLAGVAQVSVDGKVWAQHQPPTAAVVVASDTISTPR
jgi:hypothetical protein